MINRIEEIRSYLTHHDYSLAVRRMLDSCLDAEDASLLRNAVEWSKQFHTLEKKDNNSSLPETFFTEAELLLTKLAEVGKGFYNEQPLLQADKISKTYTKGNFSLQPISIQVKTGDVLGVVGENGNGKTTFLRCIAGQLALDEGKIKFHQLNNPDFYSIKHHVAFIPQRIPKWYGLLKDNLHFSASLSGIKGEQNKLMVDFMLERLNLSSYAHLTWNQISSGYRTRFEIARILLQKPTLLILDEPLANLDINAQQTILTDLRYMAKSIHHPMGIILSSQQLHEVEKVADSVMLIKKGHCLFTTTDAKEDSQAYVMELETGTDRDTLIAVLNDENIQVQFNGGFYTITSSSKTINQVISNLVSSNISITYFRDITHSTKRFF
jgi:ABC-2 type transport system ATP-binding protein